MKKRLNFMKLLLMIGLIPVTSALLISTIFSVNKMTAELQNGVYDKLDVAARDLASYYEYDIATGNLEYENDYVDSLKEKGIELTVFKEDTRVMTSILKEGSSERNVGTTADPAIYAEVKSGNVVQKEGVTIGGELYYVAYRPMYDGNGEFWGMAFAGAPETDVTTSVSQARNLLIIISFVLLALSVACTIITTLRVRKPVISAVDSLKVLAEGDIKSKVEISSPIKEIEDLINASKDLQSTLNISIGSVKDLASQLNTEVVSVADETSENVEAVSQISQAINEVATTSQSLSSSAVNLAEKSMSLGESIERLTESVKILSESSEDIRGANDEASSYMKSVLESSSQSVQAVESIASDIDRTNEAVKEIEAAIEMINAIASETKLLSLNASIEASHAGDAGKGFSVVASSIKDLAESSSENADKISEIMMRILEISSQTATNAQSVKDLITKEQKFIEDTQSKFDVLSTSVDSSITQINAIASKADDLTTIKDELTIETETLSAVSEELGASAEEVSASATQVLTGCEKTLGQTETMKDMNSQLSESVSFFK